MRTSRTAPYVAASATDCGKCNEASVSDERLPHCLNELFGREIKLFVSDLQVLRNIAASVLRRTSYPLDLVGGHTKQRRQQRKSRKGALKDCC